MPPFTVPSLAIIMVSTPCILPTFVGGKSFIFSQRVIQSVVHSLIPQQQHRHMAHHHTQDQGLERRKMKGEVLMNLICVPAVIPNSHISVSGSINALILSLTKTFSKGHFPKQEAPPFC